MRKSRSVSLSSGLPDWLRGRDAMVLVLTWAAAGVDAISYLGLGHVFTANMTGNTVLLGLAIGQGQGLAALRSIIALAGFAIGVALTAVVLELRPGRGEWPVGVTRAVAAEAIILGVFTVAWHMGTHRGALLYGLILLAALAMGIQSAAIRQLKVPGIATTYITGTLTSMVAEFISWLARVQRSPLAVDPTGQSVSLEVPTGHRYRGARLQALVLFVYVLAAVLSAVLQSGHSRLVSVSPLLAVALVTMNAWIRYRVAQAA